MLDPGLGEVGDLAQDGKVLGTQFEPAIWMCVPITQITFNTL